MFLSFCHHRRLLFSEAMTLARRYTEALEILTAQTGLSLPPLPFACIPVDEHEHRSWYHILVFDIPRDLPEHANHRLSKQIQRTTESISMRHYRVIYFSIKYVSRRVSSYKTFN